MSADHSRSFEAFLKTPISIEGEGNVRDVNASRRLTCGELVAGLINLLVCIFASLLRSLFALFGAPQTETLGSYEFENFLRDRDVIASRTSEINNGNSNVTKEFVERGNRKVVLILYGTEYGASQEIAIRLAERINASAGRNRAIPRNMEKFSNKHACLQADRMLGMNSPNYIATFIICSTQGDGVAPRGARDFHSYLRAKAKECELGAHKPCKDVSYAVLALGDKNYPLYCKCGQDFDKFVRSCGATPLFPVKNVDQEDSRVVDGWITMTAALALELLMAAKSFESDGETHSTYDSDVDGASLEGVMHQEGFHRLMPGLVTLEGKLPICSLDPSLGLTCPSSVSPLADSSNDFVLQSATSYPSSEVLASLVQQKQVYQIDFNVDAFKEGKDASEGYLYSPGDALGLWPANQKTEVQAILNHLSCSGSELVHLSSVIQRSVPISILRCAHEQSAQDHSAPQTSSRVIPTQLSIRSFLTYIADIRNLPSSLVKHITLNDNMDSQTHLLDVVRHKPELIPLELIEQLRPQQPRLYSISSSPLISEAHISITASLVHYIHCSGGYRQGVTTGQICQQLFEGSSIPAYLHPNDEFRLPEDLKTPMIMIGPGTGFAPFRSFMLHREAQLESAGISNTPYVLFYGCRNRFDAIYMNEVSRWEAKGFLMKTCVAYSRAQADKVYVQDLMKQEKSLIWRLIKEGGHIYVCGDAKKMAHSVHSVLEGVIETEGKICNPGGYIENLLQEGRYQRDVW